MNWWLKSILILLALSFVGCGGGTNTSTPTSASNPNSGSTQPINTSTTTTVSGLPDLSQAVPINLVDKTHYSGLIDIAHNIFVPLVGDPLVSIKLPRTRAQSFNGAGILVAFEDAMGFWGAALDEFDGTGSLVSQNLDVIFADDELVFRSVALLSGDTLNGALYYRVRRPGDNQCKKVISGCNPPGSVCTPIVVNTVTPCQQYMSQSSSSVKLLGYFNANYSNWAR